MKQKKKILYEKYIEDNTPKKVTVTRKKKTKGIILQLGDIVFSFVSWLKYVIAAILIMAMIVLSSIGIIALINIS